MSSECQTDEQVVGYWKEAWPALDWTSRTVLVMKPWFIPGWRAADRDVVIEPPSGGGAARGAVISHWPDCVMKVRRQFNLTVGGTKWPKVPCVAKISLYFMVPKLQIDILCKETDNRDFPWLWLRLRLPMQGGYGFDPWSGSWDPICCTA